MKSVIVNESSIEEFISKMGKEIKGGFKASLAFVFSSAKFDIRKLVVELNRFDILVIGATTVGEIFADEKAGVNSKEQTILGMFPDIDKDAIDLKILQVEKRKVLMPGIKIGKWAKNLFGSKIVL